MLAIVTTVAVPTVLLIYPLPPTPPSKLTHSPFVIRVSILTHPFVLLAYAGSHPSPPASQIYRAFIGKPHPGESIMSRRERIDMAIITILFGVLVGAFDAFSILINQIFVGPLLSPMRLLN